MPHFSDRQHRRHYKRLSVALGGQQYQHVYIVALNHTYKRRIRQVRAALHSKAYFVVEDYSVTLQCFRQYCAENPHDNQWESLLVPVPEIDRTFGLAVPNEKIGLAFTTDQCRTKVLEVLVQHGLHANAVVPLIRVVAGSISPLGVAAVPRKPTRFEHIETMRAHLFKTLGIPPTAHIALPNGTKVTASQAVLLHALGIMSFSCSFTVRLANFFSDKLRDQYQVRVKFQVQKKSPLHQMTDIEVQEAIAHTCDYELVDCWPIIIGQWYEAPNPDAARRVALMMGCVSQTVHIEGSHMSDERLALSSISR